MTSIGRKDDINFITCNNIIITYDKQNENTTLQTMSNKNKRFIPKKISIYLKLLSPSRHEQNVPCIL